MSKWQLFNLLAERMPEQPHSFYGSDGLVYRGWLQSIQREDGSGSSFNVTVADREGTYTFHLRTKD